MPDLRRLFVRMSGHRTGEHGPPQVPPHGGPGHGRRNHQHTMGLDVQHVPALRLCLSHENQYSPSWFTMPGTPGPAISVPKAFSASCDMALKNESGSAMGTGPDDFTFVVEDVLEEYREAQPEFKDMEAPIDKEGAEFFLNQNSREPVTEPDEMVPLWKILHLVGANWTYGSKGWGGENYCMFLAEDESWRHLVQQSTDQAHKLGCKTFLNTE